MNLHRRTLLKSLGSGLILSTGSLLISPSFAAPRKRRPRAALLVPLTGASAGIGLSMARAAALAQNGLDDDEKLIVIDTEGTAAGAAKAAQRAMKQDAGAILGPLFAAELPPVLDVVANRLPVIGFSNDAALAGNGAFLLGITAAQSTGAILAYARRRGVRRVALLTGTGAWAAQSLAAAQSVKAGLGLTVAPVAAAQPENLITALQQAGGGALPDALLLPDGGDQMIAAAQAVAGRGIQLLGTIQALDVPPATRGALDGAWIAAPDPNGMADFASQFQARHGAAPGLITTLAYDGARILTALATTGRLDRAALLATSFPCATGTIRFQANGLAARELAILVAGRDGYSAVDRSVGA